MSILLLFRPRITPASLPTHRSTCTCPAQNNEELASIIDYYCRGGVEYAQCKAFPTALGACGPCGFWPPSPGGGTASASGRKGFQRPYSAWALHRRGQLERCLDHRRR